MQLATDFYWQPSYLLGEGASFDNTFGGLVNYFLGNIPNVHYGFIDKYIHFQVDTLEPHYVGESIVSGIYLLGQLYYADLDTYIT